MPARLSGAGGAEAYIASLPAGEQKLLLRLRTLLLQAYPGFTERLSYGVPYYFGNRRVCFLWPASSPLASHSKGIQFGFCYGYLLDDRYGILEHGSRKQVYLVTITRASEIREAALQDLVQQAVVLDMQYPGKR